MKTMLKTMHQGPTRYFQTLIRISILYIGAKAEKVHVRKADLRENKNERNRSK